MVIWRWSLAGVLLAALSSASAGPTNGPISQSGFRVPASQQEGVPGESDMIVECRGNERVSVMVRGDHRPVTDLEILVYQVPTMGETEKLIARDSGTKDLVGVVFTPLKTGMYRIVVKNPSRFEPSTNPYNECYLSIR